MRNLLFSLILFVLPGSCYAALAQSDEIEQHLFAQYELSLDNFERHLRKERTTLPDSQVITILFNFKDFFFHDHPNEELRVISVEYFFAFIRREMDSMGFFAKEEDPEFSSLNASIDFNLFSTSSVQSQLETLESFYKSVEDFHRTMKHASYGLNTLYAQHKETEVVAMVKEYVAKLPVVDFGSFRIHYACHGADFIKNTNSLHELGGKFTANAKMSSVIFYKAVPLSALASIKKSGLRSKYGGSGKCGQFYERGLMFISHELSGASMYRSQLGAESVLLKLKIPPMAGELAATLVDYPEFFFDFDCGFAGTIPAEWIEVSYDGSSFSP